jgi:hypothetical protein
MGNEKSSDITSPRSTGKQKENDQLVEQYISLANKAKLAKNCMDSHM